MTDFCFKFIFKDHIIKQYVRSLSFYYLILHGLSFKLFDYKHAFFIILKQLFYLNYVTVVLCVIVHLFVNRFSRETFDTFVPCDGLLEVL